MAIRNSQDVTLALAQNPGNPRDSQDVILVLTKTVVSGTISDSQAAQTLAISGVEENTIGTVQASQTLAVSGSQIIKLRDSQDLVLALAQNPGNPRESQDVILVLLKTGVLGSLSTSQAQQTLGATATSVAKKRPDQPDRQLHPLLKPLDFLSRPLTQAGRRSASFSTLLTEAGASRAFSMPLGARNQPIAGRVFSFTMGGLMTLGTADGTLIITPFYGPSQDGVNLGSSALQRYVGSATPIAWRLRGEIIFRQVDLSSFACLVTCTGAFIMHEAVFMFGSGESVKVDASAITPSASGALNFAATFAPSVLNASAPVIRTKYAFLR